MYPSSTRNRAHAPWAPGSIFWFWKVQVRNCIELSGFDGRRKRIISDKNRYNYYKALFLKRTLHIVLLVFFSIKWTNPTSRYICLAKFVNIYKMATMYWYICTKRRLLSLISGLSHDFCHMSCINLFTADLAAASAFLWPWMPPTKYQFYIGTNARYVFKSRLSLNLFWGACILKNYKYG